MEHHESDWDNEAWDDDDEGDVDAAGSMEELLNTMDYAIRPEALWRITAIRDVLAKEAAENDLTVREELFRMARSYGFHVRGRHVGFGKEAMAILSENADALTVYATDDGGWEMCISVWHAADVVVWDEEQGWIPDPAWADSKAEVDADPAVNADPADPADDADPAVNADPANSADDVDPDAWEGAEDEEFNEEEFLLELLERMMEQKEEAEQQDYYLRAETLEKLAAVRALTEQLPKQSFEVEERFSAFSNCCFVTIRVPGGFTSQGEMHLTELLALTDKVTFAAEGDGLVITLCLDEAADVVTRDESGGFVPEDGGGVEE